MNKKKLCQQVIVEITLLLLTTLIPTPLWRGSLNGEVGDGEAVGSMEEGERIGRWVGDLEAQQGVKAGQTEVLE